MINMMFRCRQCDCEFDKNNNIDVLCSDCYNVICMVMNNPDDYDNSPYEVEEA